MWVSLTILIFAITTTAYSDDTDGIYSIDLSALQPPDSKSELYSVPSVHTPTSEVPSVQTPIYGVPNGQTEPDRVCRPELGAEASRRFAFSVFQEVAPRGSKDRNVLLAPHTIATALAMILPGARGTTRDQIWGGLGFNTTGLTEDDIPCLLKIYSNELILERMAEREKLEPEQSNNDKQGALDQPNPLVISTASRLYGEKTYPFSTVFIERTREYGAEMAAADFLHKPEQTRESINKWVADNTNYKIMNLFGPSSINSDTKLAIASAVYFKGLWKMPFEDSFEDNFHVGDDEVVRAEFMVNLDEYRYLYSEEMQSIVVELPYDKDADGIYNASMIIVLPNDPSAFNYTTMVTEELFGAEGVIGKVIAEQPSRANVMLPKFKIEEKYDLRPILRRMGMRNMWVPSKADLSGMTEDTASYLQPLYVSDGTHKTFMEVNEKGTEAAGAAGMSVVPLSLPPRIICNRPFMFVIYEKNTNTILFIGKIGNPVKRVS